MEIKPGIAEMIREEERVRFFIQIFINILVLLLLTYLFIKLLFGNANTNFITFSIHSLDLLFMRCHTNNKRQLLYLAFVFGESFANTKSKSPLNIIIAK